MDRRVTLFVCTHLRSSGASCGARGGEAVLRALRERTAACQVSVVCSAMPCFGRCEEGVNVRLAPGGPFFQQTQLSDIDTILQSAQNFADHLKSCP